MGVYNNLSVSWGFCPKKYIVKGGGVLLPWSLIVFSLLFLWSWLHLAYTCALLHWPAFDHCDLFSQSGTSDLILYPHSFHTTLQSGVTNGSPHKERLLQLYKFETNLGNSHLVVRQLLSLGKQANISSGQGKFKWVLRALPGQSKAWGFFASNDKTSYFLGYGKATLQQSCSAVYWSVHEIRFQGNWKIWPHWPLLPLQLKESPAFGVVQPNYMI